MATVLRILPALVMALALWGVLGVVAGAANRGAGPVAQLEFAVEASAV